MRIQIEFLGVARLAAQTSEVQLEVTDSDDIGDLLASRWPVFFQQTPAGRPSPAPGWLLSRNGDTFHPDEIPTLEDGDTLVILGADAGG